jgi:zinc transport system substrate-binding protein
MVIVLIRGIVDDMVRTRTFLASIGVGVSLLGPLSACDLGASGAGDGTLTVAASFYPIEDIVRNVGGVAIDVITVVPPGEAAHEYEPTPKQLTALERADIVFYLGNGFQPEVEKAIESLPGSVQKVDLLDGLTLLPLTAQLPGTDGETDGASLGDGNDPHVWLDPANMRAMTDVVARHLAAAPGGATPDVTLHPAQFDSNAARYDAALATIGEAFATSLAHCESDVLVTSHRAFGYLAAAYGLTQVAIAGISPTEEPSAKSLEAVAAFAREHDVTTIYFEDNLPADLATTVAEEIGAGTAVLDPAESLSHDQLDAGATYLSVMRQNLAALTKGLRCT